MALAVIAVRNESHVGEAKHQSVRCPRRLLDESIAELDAGLGVETTPAKLIEEALAELGLSG